MLFEDELTLDLIKNWLPPDYIANFIVPIVSKNYGL